MSFTALPIVQILIPFRDQLISRLQAVEYFYLVAIEFAQVTFTFLAIFYFRFLYHQVNILSFSSDCTMFTGMTIVLALEWLRILTDGHVGLCWQRKDFAHRCESNRSGIYGLADPTLMVV